MVKLIDKYCKKKGTTVARLERELGFSNGSIGKWGNSPPSFDRVVKVATYLKIPLKQLAEVSEQQKGG